MTTAMELQRRLAEHCLPDLVVYVDGKLLSRAMVTDGKRLDLFTCADIEQQESEYMDRHPGKMDGREGHKS